LGEFDRLAGELEARFDLVLAAALERVHERQPTLIADSVFSSTEIESFAEASLAAELRGFRGDTLPETCPEADAEATRSAARVGELKIILNAYWALHGRLGEAWLELVESSGLDEAERTALLRRGLNYFVSYAEQLSAWTADIYQTELERASRDATHRRFYAVRSVLGGDHLAATRIEYELEQHHLALIASGDQAAPALRALARELDRRVLVVGPIRGIWWAWMSGSRPLAVPQERLLRGYRPPGGVSFGLSLEGFGEAGFRSSHRQALRAFALSEPDQAPFVRFEHIAVESLAGENREEARAFVARELRGIDDDSASSQHIRETLVAYFAAEYNAASAAAALGVHQQTVANRLRTAEERLGHPIGSRRIELELALRLRDSLERDMG
jgi:hypothetical protein